MLRTTRKKNHSTGLERCVYIQHTELVERITMWLYTGDTTFAYMTSSDVGILKCHSDLVTPGTGAWELDTLINARDHGRSC